MSEHRSRREGRSNTAPEKTTDPKVQPGSVYVEKGTTVNLGDYNSYRLNIGMNLPINYTPEDLANAKKAVRICAQTIQDEMDRILEGDDII